MTSDHIPLTLYRGLPYKETWALFDDDEQTIPSDLTDCTFDGAIGPMSGAGPNYPIVVEVIGDPLDGQAELSIAQEHIALLLGSLYLWNVTITGPDGVERLNAKGPANIVTTLRVTP